MIIDINQKKIAIGDKYRIYIDEKETHSASSVLFTFLSEIDLFENSSGKTKLTLKKRWSWFKAKYDIYKYDYSKFEYRTISLWKGHYQCLVGKDLYDIFCHKGRKHSVYKNNIQVAWWDKNCVTWFEVDIPLQRSPRFRHKVRHPFRYKGRHDSAGKVATYSGAKYATLLLI